MSKIRQSIQKLLNFKIDNTFTLPVISETNTGIRDEPKVLIKISKFNN